MCQVWHQSSSCRDLLACMKTNRQEPPKGTEKKRLKHALRVPKLDRHSRTSTTTALITCVPGSLLSSGRIVALGSQKCLREIVDCQWASICTAAQFDAFRHPQPTPSSYASETDYCDAAPSSSRSFVARARSGKKFPASPSSVWGALDVPAVTWLQNWRLATSGSSPWYGVVSVAVGVTISKRGSFGSTICAPALQPAPFYPAGFYAELISQ